VISHRERGAHSSSTALEWAGVAEVVTAADRAVTPKALLARTRRAPPTLTAGRIGPGTHIEHEDLALISPYITTPIRRFGRWELDLTPPPPVRGHLNLPPRPKATSDNSDYLK
jgi:hypothetical protein